MKRFLNTDVALELDNMAEADEDGGEYAVLKATTEISILSRSQKSRQKASV